MANDQTFYKNQRVSMGEFGNEFQVGTVVGVEKSAFGDEVLIERDYALPGESPRPFLQGKVKLPSTDGPLFGVLRNGGALIFVTAEPLYSAAAVEANETYKRQGYGWYRCYTDTNATGASGHVQIAQIMELTPEQFEDGKNSGWHREPQVKFSRLSDLGL